MATTEEPNLAEERAIANNVRERRSFGLGVFLALLTGALALIAVIFIWFGFIPSLVLMIICVPLGLLASRNLRKGSPANLPE